MSSSKNKILDFGFTPEESKHHFLFYQKANVDHVLMLEVTDYVEDRDFSSIAYTLTAVNSPLRCQLTPSKWNLVEKDVKAEFNRRLRDQGIKSATFRKGGFTHLHRLLGKELLVLAWAIEDADPGVIPQAVQNWVGLRPEERWWLYTMTSAATGNAINDRGIGWRRALRHALTENPITHGRIDTNIIENSPLFMSDVEPKDRI
ncbi:MAG: DUF3780 domain-containing protein [Flavobacteriales bacterium]